MTRHSWLFTCLFLATGCRSTVPVAKPSAVGVWALDRGSLTRVSAKTTTNAAASYELKADGTFLCGLISGTYRVEGNALTLTDRMLSGIPLNHIPDAHGRTLTGQLSDDGSSLTIVDPSSREPVTYKRAR